MSRHFNYELNENRIKLLLQKNSMSFSEDVWNEFLTKTKPIEKVNKLPNFKINFAINKSVLLTGIFVVLIGSFTVLIAKFVDFSDTKSNTENIREVKPDPDNFKLEKLATALPKKEEAKATPTIAPITSTMNSVMPNITSTLAASTPTYAGIPSQQNSYAATQPSDTGSENQNMAARTMPDSSVSNQAKSDSTSITQVPNNQPRNLRKRKKKEAEVLETKPMTQELPIGGTSEQEPELKLD
jgi:hypothetical protein